MSTWIMAPRFPVTNATAALAAFAAGVVAAQFLSVQLDAGDAFMQDTVDHDRRGARNLVVSEPTYAMVLSSDPINQRGARIRAETDPAIAALRHQSQDSRARLASR